LRSARLTELENRYGIQTTAENTEVFNAADVVILAVKPQHMDNVLKALSQALPQALTGVKLVISVAAGFPIEKIERHLYPPLDQDAKGLLPIVRVMPNTPALVLAGMAGLSANDFVTETELRDAKTILEAVGRVIQFEEEALHAVTAISGSGPAYIFYFVEAFVETGINLGLRPSQALTLTLETMKGAAKLLEETAEAPAELRKKVTSKGGTTEAALTVLEQHGVKEHLKEAIRAAAERSVALGQME
jgi:pyrroline-5-carboxylate reductase